MFSEGSLENRLYTGTEASTTFFEFYCFFFFLQKELPNKFLLNSSSGSTFDL